MDCGLNELAIKFSRLNIESDSEEVTKVTLPNKRQLSPFGKNNKCSLKRKSRPSENDKFPKKIKIKHVENQEKMKPIVKVTENKKSCLKQNGSVDLETEVKKLKTLKHDLNQLDVKKKPKPLNHPTRSSKSVNENIVDPSAYEVKKDKYNYKLGIRVQTKDKYNNSDNSDKLEYYTNAKSLISNYKKEPLNLRVTRDHNNNMKSNKCRLIRVPPDVKCHCDFHTSLTNLNNEINKVSIKYSRMNIESDSEEVTKVTLPNKRPLSPFGKNNKCAPKRKSRSPENDKFHKIIKTKHVEKQEKIKPIVKDYKMSIEHEMNIENLISLVQERQSLYDYKHKNYSNRNIQEQLWTEISDILKIPANECKEIWTTLRNSFSRQLREQKKMPSESSLRKKKWYLFNNMLFLSDYVSQHKKIENNLNSSHINNLENDSFVEEPIVPDTEQNLETVKQEVISQTIVNEDAENEKSSNETLFEKPRTNRKMLPSERVVEPKLEFLKTKNQPKNNNEDTPELYFFKSIIPDFLKLNDKNQRQFKKIVLNAIDQLLDSQETSYEIPRYYDAPHSSIIPNLSPYQQYYSKGDPWHHQTKMLQ